MSAFLSTGDFLWISVEYTEQEQTASLVTDPSEPLPLGGRHLWPAACCYSRRRRLIVWRRGGQSSPLSDSVFDLFPE